MKGIVERTEVMGDYDNTALEFFDSDRKSVNGLHVQMIRGLI
jgi:hypothetical protein